jgi:hypothetical protein
MKTNMFHNIIDKVEKVRTQFGYKPVYNQLATTHYMKINKIIHLYF